MMNREANPSAQRPKSEASKTSNLDYVALIVRNRWVLIGILAAFLGAAILYTKLVTPTYDATSGVLINTRYSENPKPPFADVREYNPTQNPIENEMEVLKSRSLLDTVAMMLLARRYVDEGKQVLLPILAPTDDDTATGSTAPLDVVVRRLKGTVNIESVREAEVVRITARSTHPVEAALIANVYAKAYYDRNLNASRWKAKSIRESLETELTEKHRTLALAEDSLRKYMEQKGVVSLDDEARKVNDQLAQLQASRDAVDVEIRSLARNITSYREEVSRQEQNVAAVMEGANDPYIRLIQEQLAKLEVQRDMTIAQNPSIAESEVYGSTLKDIDNQITSLRSKLKVRTDQYLKNVLPAQEGSGPTEPAGYLRQIKQKMLSSEVEIQALLSKRDALNEAIKQYEGQFGRLPAKTLQYARLQRDKMSVEQVYSLIQEKYNQASLQERSEFGYVDIFDPARVPREPSRPRPLVNLTAGLILGLGFGLAFVLMRESAGARVQTPEELKKRGFVVLATISRMDREKKRVGHTFGSSGNKKVPQVFLVALKSPFSSTTESYRLLRTNLEFALGTDPLRTILVTSCSPGEGKTTTAANLAVVLAQAGRTVLLVDGDMRKPSLHESLEVKLKPGLSDLLCQTASYDSAISRTALKNLFVLPGGSVPPNPAELLGSSIMRENLELFKMQFDVVILDSPPVLAVTDPCVLSTAVDGVILVVSAGETRVHQLDQAVEMLVQVHGKMPAVVMNKFSIHQAYGFSYGRAGYGHYRYVEGYHGNRQNGRGRRRYEKA